MTDTALRYYSSTLSYTQTERLRKIRDMKLRFRTRISRRRAKQAMHYLLRTTRLSQ